MDQWDRELAKAGIQMAGAAGKGMGNVMAAVMDGLIEKGVFSIEEVRDMLDRLEVAVTRVEGEIEGDLPQEAEVAATMAIVGHLRDILISKGRRDRDIAIDNTRSRNSTPYTASRSRSRNRGVVSHGNASRICCATHAIVGFAVAPECMIWRRSWWSTMNPNRRRNVAVGTTKQSIDARQSA